ncbi:MAG: glyoxalase/bleomycin resistance/extradiol dioxygenase family protein [Leptospiraceae bacterium]|nr:glyoxalase/bleomycin resistance/extradiol dioxygenase family protein [Leptospiraceae bacterium]
MAKLFPYLNFENAKEALEYYEKYWDAVVYERMTVMPEMAKEYGIPEEKIPDTTMHASFGVLNNTILCSDRFDSKENFSSNHGILLDFNSEDETEMESLNKLYTKIVESGTVKIITKLDDQFWGGKFGLIIDKFGFTWMFHAQPYSKLEDRVSK